MKIKKNIIVTVLILTWILGIIILIQGLQKNTNYNVNNDIKASAQNLLKTPTPKGTNSLKRELETYIKKDISLTGIFIKNFNSGEEISINGENIFQSASVIKIAILMTVMEKIQQKVLNLNTSLILKSTDKVGGAGNLIASSSGSNVTIKELLELMITISDNTATNILIDKIGMGEINNFIKKMNLKKTILQRKMMDFEAIKKGKDNFTSPKDMGDLLDIIYRCTNFTPDLCKFMIDLLAKNKDRTTIPKLIPSNIKISHKTGELVTVRGDAGIVFLDKNPFIISIFVKGGDIKKAEKIISQVSLMTYKYFSISGSYEKK